MTHTTAPTTTQGSVDEAFWDLVCSDPDLVDMALGTLAEPGSSPPRPGGLPPARGRPPAPGSGVPADAVPRPELPSRPVSAAAPGKVRAPPTAGRRFGRTVREGARR